MRGITRRRQLASRLVAAYLLGAAGGACAAPLEQPTLQTTVQIEREIGGGCSAIRAGRSRSSPTLIMNDVCHGWISSSCQDKLLFVGHGVIEDQGEVLFTDRDRALDLIEPIDRAINRRWPGHEHLHLQFAAASCEGDEIVVPFSGSHLKANSNGSAAGLRGRIRVRSPSQSDVSVGGG